MLKNQRTRINNLRYTTKNNFPFIDKSRKFISYRGIKTLCTLLLVASFTQAQVAKELKHKDTLEQTRENKEVLLKKYYQLTQEDNLHSIGGNTIFKDETLTAIQFPVGGIGTGCIQYNGSAEPKYWQIFNNMGHQRIPNSFFAIRVKNKSITKVRALQTTDIGSFKGMQSLEASSKFPFITYNFKDELPVKVSMEVYNPFIPTNLKDSGIPAAFYQFTIENTSTDTVSINLLASQQNAVGFSKLPHINREKSFADNFNFSINRKPIKNNVSSLYGGNTNEIITTADSKIAYMDADIATNSQHYGQMALILLGDTKLIQNSEAISSWKNEKQFYNYFLKKGLLKGSKTVPKSKKGTTWSTAINTKITLAPGEKKVVNMALAWYFPNGKNGGFLKKWDAWGKGDWIGNGNKYATHFKNMQELISFIKTDHKRVRAETNMFSNSLYQSNLPYWLTERLANQLAILKSRTIFHDKENYIGLWEGTGGVDGSCSGNCNHVWHYAQAHARLFPEMGKAIRNQTFNALKDNGQIPYRQPSGTPAFDGQCGDILGAYREYLLSDDTAWLQSQYPAIKKAMNYIIKTHDSDKDGWLSDAPKHTTYDASMSGNPSFLSSLYLAALKASEKMALATKDETQAIEWHNIAEKSAQKQNEKLWNGSYFIQIAAEKKATDYETACHSDQLLGQWWADQLGLGSLYPDYKIKAATEAILTHNFKSRLTNHNQGHRTFALENEAGFVVSTWPNNDRTPYASGYSSEVWSTFEYTIGAALFKYNKTEDALTVLKSGFNRYNGKLKTGYIGAWGNFGFSGNPFGDDECGQFYGRALANWSVLLAAQGFYYNGPEKKIGFNPKWKPENHISFFSTANGWGNFYQNRKPRHQKNSIHLKYGTLKLKNIKLSLEDSTLHTIQLRLNGKLIPILSTSKVANSTTIYFKEITLIKDTKLEVLFKP